MRLLRPAEYLPSIFAVDLRRLRDRGIRGLMVDLDNTLVAWRYPRPTAAVRQWVDQVEAAGLQVCIVSNGGRARVDSFGEALGVPRIGRAAKPFPRAFRGALGKMGLQPAEAAVVGDQLFTDVLGGNILGCYTILVVPISCREFLGTRCVRVLERQVLTYWERHGLLVRE